MLSERVRGTQERDSAFRERPRRSLQVAGRTYTGRPACDAAARLAISDSEPLVQARVSLDLIAMARPRILDTPTRVPVALAARIDEIAEELTAGLNVSEPIAQGREAHERHLVLGYRRSHQAHARTAASRDPVRMLNHAATELGQPIAERRAMRLWAMVPQLRLVRTGTSELLGGVVSA
ncbi:MAG: hypothetical protein M3065_18430 [Actinomycetota bacterium]|nr:hypothetical protein [Actinomycetota bacterium]